MKKGDHPFVDSDRRFRHGLARRSGRAPEYYVWANMLVRCANPSSKSYRDYGARGIKVCARWRRFKNFYEDMGPRPTKEHTLERIDNDQGYGPGNCRWATRKEQAANKRPPAKRVNCLRGHPFNEANTYMRRDGKRGCKLCRAINMREFYARKKAA